MNPKHIPNNTFQLLLKPYVFVEFKARILFGPGVKLVICKEKIVYINNQ